MATKTPVNKICDNCIHFSRLEEKGNVVRGECKKYPPQVVSVPAGGITSAYPEVRNIDRCSQFSSKK